MRSILADAFSAFNNHSGWIVWNLFLAFIPLALSFALFFRRNNKRGFFWWLGFAVFISFLPNAPYLLTDVIHLIEAIRAGYSIWITTLVFIPLHCLAMFLGWEAYVISVINQSRYLRMQGRRRWVFVSEVTTHALCAIGIFLGRFLRFNSWDFVTQPDVLLTSAITDLTEKTPIVIMLITFTILTILYWLTKQVTLGTMLRVKQSLANLDLRQNQI